MCYNVVERILKDPTHPITQKQTVKSHQEASNTSQKLLEKKHTGTTTRNKNSRIYMLSLSLYINIDKFIWQVFF